ncbi:hypothetical protein IWQ62_004689 [Dispira parvispora]|uniref:DUF7905 domain-containing protein n=1 Tax=Dispira parvispora TaxID=1520584 RepID=A0A9W8E569_9FUNG|nr:hypothetical protein IWQ62_004689 [Dispira parvispora]
MDRQGDTTHQNVDPWAISQEDPPPVTSLTTLLHQDTHQVQIIKEGRVNPIPTANTTSSMSPAPPSMTNSSVASGPHTVSLTPEPALTLQWPIPPGSYGSSFFNMVLHQINMLARKTDTIIRYVRTERAIEIRGQQRNILTAKAKLDHWYHQEVVGPSHLINTTTLNPMLRGHSIEGSNQCKIDVIKSKRIILVTAKTRVALKAATNKVRNMIHQSYTLLENEPRPTHMFGMKPSPKSLYYFNRVEQPVVNPGDYPGLSAACLFKLKTVFDDEEPANTLEVGPGLTSKVEPYLVNPGPRGDYYHISGSLIGWLDRLRWFRGMVELRVHFGELYFTKMREAHSRYPSDLVSTVFSNPSMNSLFIPSLKFGTADLQGLVNRLELKSPFKHTSTREGFFLHCHDAGVTHPTPQQECRVQFLVSNRNKPTAIGWPSAMPWKVYTDRQTWVDFRCANPKGPYDWRVALSTRSKIPSKADSKYRVLANGFTLNKDGSFSFTNTNNLHVHSVAYEIVAQLKYNGFVITATQHQWWNCCEYPVFTNTPYSVRDAPDHTTLSLSIGVERWEQAFLEHSQHAAGLPVKYNARDLVNPAEMDQLWRLVPDVHAALR